MLLFSQDKAVGKGVEDVLRKAGYSPHSVYEPEIATALCAEGGYDALILDTKQYFGDAFEIARQIRSTEQGKMVIIFVTDMPAQEVWEKSSEVGGNDYVMKPVEGCDLLDRLSEQMNLALDDDNADAEELKKLLKDLRGE